MFQECPECNEESVKMTSKQYYRHFECQDCGHEWEEDYEAPAQKHYKAIGYSEMYISQAKQREKYEKMYGPIPGGWELHHIDHNPQNDSPANLIAVPKFIHRQIHDNPRAYGSKEAIKALLIASGVTQRSA